MRVWVCVRAYHRHTPPNTHAHDTMNSAIPDSTYVEWLGSTSRLLPEVGSDRGCHWPGGVPTPGTRHLVSYVTGRSLGTRAREFRRAARGEVATTWRRAAGMLSVNAVGGHNARLRHHATLVGHAVGAVCVGSAWCGVCGC